MHAGTVQSRAVRANVLIVAVLVAGCAGAPVKRRATAREAYDDGVAFLLKRQNPDGSFSHGGRTTGFDVPMGSPESHRAFKVACTALCVMALRGNPGAAVARRRAIDWLLAQGKTTRALPGELYNVWTHIFVVQALAEDVREDPVGRDWSGSHGNSPADVIVWNLRMLERYESMWGGWQYYDWLGSQHPALEPTSFTTASALVAMHAASEAGIEVDPKRAIRIVEECRNPDGSYNYDWSRIPRPQAEINKKKGNISRAQACNDALRLWRRVDRARVIADLDLFFREHKWLDVARKRPIPHEGWYAHAGYFYYYSHWYASRNIVWLGADGERFRRPLLDAILPHQEADGSWWDFPDYTYDVFYGTAQALLALRPFVSR